jgi:hypothetical protein
MSDQNNHNAAKLIGAILVIVAAGGWTFHRVRSAQPGAVANNGVADEFQGPTPEGMKKEFQQAASYAELSTTQTQKLEELQGKMQAMWQGRRDDGRHDEMTTAQREAMRGQFQAMRQQMQDIRQQYDQVMTQEQQGKFRAAMNEQRSKRETKLKAALSEADYKRYQERRRGGRGGPGGGRGGPGGRGGGQQGGQPGSGGSSPRPLEI